MSFHIVGPPGERFTGFFALSDEHLTAQGGAREHHPLDSQYRMRFASYIRKGEKACGQVDEVPEELRTRVLAVRSFNKDAVLVADEVVEGRDIEIAIE